MPERKPRASASPTTLSEAIVYFSDPNRAHDFVTKLRFPNGLACPRMGCGSTNVGTIATRRMIQCKDCKKQSSVKVGTIFEDSPIGFDRWLPAMWMIAGDRNGISSHELARAIGVTQKTAWFMLHRIRLAMKEKSLAPPLSGEVEADETYVGGAFRNKRGNLGRQALDAGRKGGPGAGKAAVFGMVQRTEDGRPSQVRAMTVPDNKRLTLMPRIEANVARHSTVYTDALRSYGDLAIDYKHEVIDHAIAYVEGRVTTNRVENFGACLKRTLGGTYIATKPFHLDAYLDEQCFRFNNRDLPDAARLDATFSGVEGRRLTYKQLTTGHTRWRLQPGRVAEAINRRKERPENPLPDYTK